MLAAMVAGAIAAAAQPHKVWTDAPIGARPTAPPQSIAQLVKQAMPAVVQASSGVARSTIRRNRVAAPAESPYMTLDDGLASGKVRVTCACSSGAGLIGEQRWVPGNRGERTS